MVAPFFLAASLFLLSDEKPAAYVRPDLLVEIRQPEKNAR